MASHDHPRIVKYNKLNGKYLKDAGGCSRKKTILKHPKSTGELQQKQQKRAMNIQKPDQFYFKLGMATSFQLSNQALS